MDKFEKEFNDFLDTFDDEVLFAELEKYGFNFKKGTGKLTVDRDEGNYLQKKNKGNNILIENSFDDYTIIGQREIVEKTESSKLTIHSYYSLQTMEEPIIKLKHIDTSLDQKSEYSSDLLTAC